MRSEFKRRFADFKIANEELTAVIIKGNPQRITDDTYKGIYEDLKKVLEEMGIEVVIDEGKPHTTPEPANIWIGHSRGVDRLQFAPERTLTIKMGSDDEDSLNHPEEVNSVNPEDYDKLSNEQKSKHLTLHPSVTQKIREKIEETFEIVSGSWKEMAKVAAISNIDKQVLAFALNLEYMEVAYYEGLSKIAYTKDHDGAGLYWLMREILDNEKAHVKFLRAQLGDDAPERPEIDIGALKGVAKLAGIDDFDPYANWESLLLGGMAIEDVGVTAYAGAASVVEDTDIKLAVAGILSTEAHHMGMVRSFLYYKFHADDVANKLKAFQKSESGLAYDQPINDSEGHANFVPSDSDGIGFARTPRQVMNMVFGKKDAMQGGLFPEGLNGNFDLLLG